MSARTYSLTSTLAVAALAAFGAGVAVLTWTRSGGKESAPAAAAAEDDHHHSPSDHAEIKITATGLQNVGFEPFTVDFRDYERRLELPAMVVERPGRSQTHITAPLTGVISEIGVVEGQSVTPGDPLLRMRLTHEELVSAQRDFLADLAQLEVVEREAARLKGLGKGVVPGKRIIDLEYEQQKLLASLHAEKQAMVLHGLTKQQVNQIRDQKRLLQTIVVSAPDHTHEDGAIDEHPLIVQRLSAAVGQQVEVGEELAVLADHHELLVEASAFADDAQAIRASAAEGRKASVRLASGGEAPSLPGGLEVLYVAGQVDPVSRALKVYLLLPNRAALDKTTPDGKRFFEWRFKPGQRMQVGVAIESLENQLVLPAAAVVDDGVEAYVYRQNGDHFEQVPVHLRARDKEWVVVANDGALFPGDVIAGRGAYQIHLALKSQTGGGVDPHAGHNH
ncbi:HlyD family secretion protein [Posidoniimonas corsicana]|uniref:HlyD family secretion protein n=1 Tax=Posidoniimonas corsicana TaxID=1938618 RepID=A0A5C5V9Z3_9BACT|nr:efflux RND transporter periplasmic adaptor subunit [Posidoniimonas corsicana]TWT35424.1 HlyD family secretion protein [Posidoniimonas corsicana]